MSNARRAQTRSGLRPGDEVRVPWGAGYHLAVITEDRGCIGIGGRRLLRVQLVIDPADSDPIEFELPAADVEPVA